MLLLSAGRLWIQQLTQFQEGCFWTLDIDLTDSGMRGCRRVAVGPLQCHMWCPSMDRCAVFLPPLPWAQSQSDPPPQLIQIPGNQWKMCFEFWCNGKRQLMKDYSPYGTTLRWQWWLVNRSNILVQTDISLNQIWFIAVIFKSDIHVRQRKTPGDFGGHLTIL